MDQHIKKVYVPMTETAFYILLCLRKPNHGYGVVQRVEKMTDGAIKLAPGTMYGSLSKMEKDNLIRFVREEEKRKQKKYLKEENLTVRVKEYLYDKYKIIKKSKIITSFKYWKSCLEYLIYYAFKCWLLVKIKNLMKLQKWILKMLTR